MGPLSLPSLRRTSFSSAASSPKSTVGACALQSAALRFVNVGVGAGAGTVGDGAGGTTVTEGAASGAAAVSVFGSSHAITDGNRRIRRKGRRFSWGREPISLERSPPQAPPSPASTAFISSGIEAT